MGKSGININLDLDSVKLNKLHRDADIKDNFNIKTTSSDVTVSSTVKDMNKYGGVSSSEVETMDLSSSTADTSGTNSSIKTDSSSMIDSSGSNISKVSDTNNESINSNIDIGSSSNATNNSSNGGSVDSYTNGSNNGVNSSSSTNDLGMGNLSSNPNDPNGNKDLDIRDKKNKPSIDSNESSTSTRGSSTNLNVNSSQSTQSDSQGSNSTSKLGASFDMPENSTENVVEEASTSGDTITITTLDANGNEVAIEVNVDEYTNLLEAFGIIQSDINRVLNNEITLEGLIEEIQTDTDDTRRKEMFYTTNLQAYGLEFTDINELEQEINKVKQTLKELRNQGTTIDNHEIDAVVGFIYRLQNGENLESILTSQIVAWEYVDENGNKKYRYDDPYAAGYMDGITYTPYTFEEMYKDSTVLKELKEHLTEQPYKPLFSDEEKTVHVWDGSAEQQEYFDKLLENYGNTVNERKENVDKIDVEISELEEKVNIYESIYNAIEGEEDYQFNIIDPYLHKEDFYENNSFNESALDTISALQETYKNIYVSLDSPIAPAIYITDKEDLVNILSCIINGEGNISNGYLQVGQNMFNLSSPDNILSDYLKYLPYIDEEQKEVFNYIYNTDGIDKAYDFLNEKLYDRLDNKWYSETSLVYEDFAKEHEIIASIGSIVVTPFEGISAFCYSMNALLTNQKIRRTGTISSGNIARSTVAQEIAEDSEILSFIYSTGMSMADSAVLIGLSVATGGIAGAGAAGAGAAAMAGSSAALRIGTGLISAVTMGSRAYVSTLNEALDRGLSDGKAVLLSTVSAVVETAMENMSVSHLLNLESKLGVGVENLTAKIADRVTNEKLANILTKGFYASASAVSQALVEGEEELSTEILNYVADIFISKDLSNYTQSLEYYMNELGYDEDAALLQTSKDFSAQAFQAFLGGFASGICFGAFSGVRTVQRSSYAIANDMYGELNGKTQAQKFAQVLEINKSQLQEFNDLADKKQRGEALTTLEEYFLDHGTVEMQIAQNMKDARSAKIRGLIKYIKEIIRSEGSNTGKPVDVNGIENFDAAARDFAEGNKVLEELLLTSHKYNVDTIACCGGHIGHTTFDTDRTQYKPYIAFKMTAEFERCLPTILETLGERAYNIVFIKNTAESGRPSFVIFNQTNYNDEMFTTLNSVIENVMGNEAYITNVSENTSKMMELYNFLSSNDLSVPVQFEISKKVVGLESTTSYKYCYGRNSDKGTFDSKEFVPRITEAKTSLVENLESVSKGEETASFTPENSWVTTLFSDIEDVAEANELRVRVLQAVDSISAENIRNDFKEFIIKSYDILSIERIEHMAQLLIRYVDRYITNNNAEEGAIDLSTIPKEKFKIDRYRKSEELFQEGSYGGDQSNVENIVVSDLSGESLSYLDKQKSVILISLVKKYFPNVSDTDIKNIVKSYAEKGCWYMAVANSFITYMNSLENGAEIFKDKMGFDLAVTEWRGKSLNVEAVALDLYLYVCTQIRGCGTVESLLAKANGVSIADCEEIVQKYFKDKNINVECTMDLFNNQSYNHNILVSDILFDDGFFILGSEGFKLEKLVADAISKSDKALSDAKVSDTCIEDIGAHAMLITDVTENGDFVVSSWSGKYEFSSPKEEVVDVLSIKYHVNDVKVTQSKGVSDLISYKINGQEYALPVAVKDMLIEYAKDGNLDLEDCRYSVKSQELHQKLEPFLEILVEYFKDLTSEYSEDDDVVSILANTEKFNAMQKESAFYGDYFNSNRMITFEILPFLLEGIKKYQQVISISNHSTNDANKLVPYKVDGKEYTLPVAVKDMLTDFMEDGNLDLWVCKYTVKRAQELHQKLEPFLDVLVEYFKNLTSEYIEEKDVKTILSYVEQYSAYQKKSAFYKDYAGSNSMIVEVLPILLDGIKKYQQVTSLSSHSTSASVEGKRLSDGLAIAKMFKDPKGYLFVKLFDIFNNRNVHDDEVSTLVGFVRHTLVYWVDVNQLYNVLYKYLTPEEQVEIDNLLADPLRIDNMYTQEEKDAVAVFTGDLGPYIGATLRKKITNFRGVQIDGRFSIKDVASSFEKMKISGYENYDTSFEGFIRTLDTIISKSPPLEESIVVTRAAAGIFINGDKISINDLEPGTIFTDDSYVSTTLKSAGGIPAFNDRDVFMEITLPEGTRGAYLESFSGVGGYGQQEFLLPRGSKFEITDYPIYKDGHFIIKVRLILDE